MTQKTWLLDIDIVRIARQCSALVHQEFARRLPLAHSDFLGQIQAYAEQSDSITLKKATRELLESVAKTRDPAEQSEAEAEEMVEYMGRPYPRWREGREFSGVYRGAPVYRDQNPNLDP